MEPLMSLEGYNILENTERSRTLLNDFYQEQGYRLASEHSVEPSAHAPAKQPEKKHIRNSDK